MRRTVQILACLLLSLGWHPVATWAQAPVLDEANAFVTRWQGEAGEPIQVPLYGNYAYRWEKADGTVVKSGVVTVREKKVLDLPVAENGEYVLKAGPAGVKRIEFGEWDGYWYGSSRGTPGALLRVEQWGSVAWESFAGAFFGCKNMNIAEGAGRPDLSGVQSMHSAFEGCGSFNSPIGAWDVSRVTSMREMFRGCVSFNQPLEKWDVSKVTDMRWMFWECSSFNQPLEKWDVSKVTDMRWMFWECSSFNQPLGGWTLSALARDEERSHELGLMRSGLDAANYSATLVAWAAKRDKLQAGVRVRADGLWYNAAGKAARQQLIDGKGWKFEDDGEVLVSLTGITVSPTTARLAIGGTQQLTVGYTPADAANKAVTWSSSDEEVATVDAAGVVTAKGKGSATITATAADGGHTATCAVTVTSVALTSITVSPTSKTLKVNETLQLTVGYTPENATNRAVTWSSSDEDVATVDAEGKVTAKGKGTATITVTSADGEHTATCEVTVTAPVALTGITVSPTSVRLGIGGTQALTVGYTPVDATNRAVTWSSNDERVATVSEEGLVMGKGEGTAKITVTSVDGGHTATCVVTVVAPVALTGITVVPTSAQLKVGLTQQLALGYTPADATNRRVTWHSSDKGVATVDAQGLVTGVKGGTATITATSADGGHTASCTVEVTAPVALTSISVTPTSKTLKVTETQQLTVSYTPTDATNRAVTWSSSDAGVATVDAQGKVTGVKGGTATITVTSVDGGHTATCSVTVVPPVALTGITVMPTSAQLKVGLTQQLALGYTPADATNRAVAWSSSDAGVATVDAQGKVTGVKAGSATITARSADGGHTATCSVTVVADEKPSGVESVALACVSISPNPFGDALLVRGAEGVQRYALVSATGAVELRGRHDGASELRLETGRLAAGMYWLRLEATDGERVVQVVRR